MEGVEGGLEGLEGDGGRGWTRDFVWRVDGELVWLEDGFWGGLDVRGGLRWCGIRWTYARSRW